MSLKDEVERFPDSLEVFPFNREWHCSAEPDSEKHGVIRLEQRSQFRRGDAMVEFYVDSDPTNHLNFR